MLERINRASRHLTALIGLLLVSSWLLPTTIALAQAPAPAAAPSTAASPAAPPQPITTADIKGVAGPSTDHLAKGDPGGSITGTVNDIVVSDTKAGLSLADVVNQIGQNRIAINFVWTLVT